MKKAVRLTLCALLLVLTLLLSGCLKMHFDIVWNEDNTGTMSITMGLQKSAMEMMGITESDIRSQFKDSMQEDSDDYTFKDYSDSEYTGIVATMKIDDITKGTAGATDTLKFSCIEDGKKKTYSISGNFNGSAALGDNEDISDAGITLDSVDMKMSVVMPGNITSHNADEKQGNKLVWDLTKSSILKIEATSELSGRGGGAGGIGKILLWVAIIAVVLGGGAAVFLILSRKKKAAPPPPYAQGYAPYQSPAAPPPAAPYGYTDTSAQTQYSQPSPQAYEAPAGQVYGVPVVTPPAAPVYEAPPAAPVYEAPPAAPVYEAPPAAPVYEAPPVVSVSAFVCANCGAAIPEGAKFCVLCGGAAVAAAQQAPVLTQCPNCGVALAPGAKFCTSCGYMIQN